MAVYSLEEVSQHNDKESCWLVIDDGVYDVTKYLAEHPGGEEVMLEQGGQESTEQFNDVGHSTDAREILKKYKIGELREEDRAKSKEVTDKASVSGLNTSWIVAIAVVVGAAVIYSYRLYSR